jgi:nuclear pore complex protein Nup133
MFAKTAAASRNPRRRQRTSSDDSVKPPIAKRQRSVLRQTGDSQATSLNHDHREVAEPSISVPPSDHELVTTAIGPESHLPIRSAKHAEGPSNGVEGTVVLVRIFTILVSAILLSRAAMGYARLCFANAH